jgi:hypothetical protein
MQGVTGESRVAAGVRRERCGWWRFERALSGLPAPAVYIPAADLGAGDLTGLGFAAARDTAAERRHVPVTSHVVAEVGNDSRLTLLACSAPLWRADQMQARVPPGVPAVWLAGTYTRHADQSWRAEVHAARCVLVLAGPGQVFRGQLDSPRRRRRAHERLLRVLSSPATMVAAVRIVLPT